MFNWFGNGVQESGGVNWSAKNDTGYYSGSSTSPSTSMSNMSTYLSLASSATNIMSGISKYNQYSDNAKIMAQNSQAILEEYKINDLALRRNAIKQFGSLRVQTGEGGSAMDLLEESAMNMALDSWRLKFNAMQAYNAAKKAEKRAKKAAGGALGGSLGALGGMAIGAALAIPTGGLSLAAMPAIAGGAALGGSIGGAGGSMIGQM